MRYRHPAARVDPLGNNRVTTAAAFPANVRDITHPSHPKVDTHDTHHLILIP